MRQITSLIYYPCFCILHQLKFPNALQGQPHIKHIAVVHMGGHKGISDSEQHLLIQEQAQLAQYIRCTKPLLSPGCHLLFGSV